nr:1875_t:CDS:1 [Entrophospora candida]
MVRFYKPNIYSMIYHVWSSLLGNILSENNDNSSSSNYDEEIKDEQESLIVTRRLQVASHDKNQWLEELIRICNEGYQPQIIFLDTGLITSLNKINRRNFLDLFNAIAEFDGYRAGRLMIDRCKTPELVIDGEIYALKMQHLVLNVKSKTFKLGKIKISDILTDVLRMVRNHHVKLEGDFINVIISILLLEGIGRQIDPNMDLLKSSLPILRKLSAQKASKRVIEGIKETQSDDDIGGSIGDTQWLKFWIWLEAREWVSDVSWEDYKVMFERNIWWPDM